jgi:hypothetical protein
MKKLFIVLAVASLGFVACNNDSDKTETKDSTATSTETVTPPVTTPDSATTLPTDTLPKKDSGTAAPAK